MKFNSFIFENYNFDVDSHQLDLHYSLDHKLDFTETYTFDFDFVDYDNETLNRAIQSLFIMAGTSYYKTFLPKKIDLNNITLNEKDAAFYAKTYSKGLGEFYYVNKLDPSPKISFGYSQKETPVVSRRSSDGMLIGIGGGKDSLLSIEALRNADRPVATWTLGHRELLTNLVNQTGLKHFWVERSWDKNLLELNKQGAYNGHVPISAIIGCAGSVTAILSGYKDVVVSNEQAANEPTLSYRGVDINHQYSKSQEYEIDYQHHLKRNFNDSVRYYSFLRPLSELYIAELFARIAWDKYKFSFSSCNRAFRNGSHSLFWCGECPKCAFVYMVLTPFIDIRELDQIFHKNLLLDSMLTETYNNLLGISGDKPLECVGEIKESRAAMRMCQDIYPELKDKFSFELDADYDYKTLNTHSMPPDIYEYLNKLLRP